MMMTLSVIVIILTIVSRSAVSDNPLNDLLYKRRRRSRLPVSDWTPTPPNDSSDNFRKPGFERRTIVWMSLHHHRHDRRHHHHGNDDEF